MTRLIDRRPLSVITWMTASLETILVRRSMMHMINCILSSVPMDMPITTATAVGREVWTLSNVKWEFASLA